MTTPDQQAAIEQTRSDIARVRQEALSPEMEDDVRTAELVLAAYDARGKEIEALHEELARMNKGWGKDCGKAMDAVAAERDALKAKLEKYGNHLHSCDAMKSVRESGPFECTCGLSAALEGGK